MDLPEQPEPEPASEASTGSAEPAPARFRELNRYQLRWACLDLERSIGADHPARAIWELVGRLDLQEFEAECLSREGQAGRPGWPPRVLISVWIYAYSQGIASARVLGLLQSEDLLDLGTILTDGTKVRARAGKESMHRCKTLEEHCAEARKMKHAEGSWSPSYNVQVQTELQSRMGLGSEVTQAACDAEELVGGLETVERNTGVQPAQMVADERSVGARKRRGIQEEFRAGLFTPEPDRDALRCPQGRCLEFVKIREHHDVMCKVYEAAQRIYKRRGEVAEFPHMWWKGIWKWRRFSVRGLARAGQEALWVALSYNVQQWIRLRWQPRLAVV